MMVVGAVWPDVRRYGHFVRISACLLAGIVDCIVQKVLLFSGMARGGRKDGELSGLVVSSWAIRITHGKEMDRGEG